MTPSGSSLAAPDPGAAREAPAQAQASREPENLRLTLNTRGWTHRAAARIAAAAGSHGPSAGPSRRSWWGGWARTHDRRIMCQVRPGASYALAARIPRSHAAGDPDRTVCTRPRVRIARFVRYLSNPETRRPGSRRDTHWRLRPLRASTATKARPVNRSPVVRERLPNGWFFEPRACRHGPYLKSRHWRLR
jgi:hypothetical protein